MKLKNRRKKCPSCGRKTFFVDDCGEWQCSFCHYRESTIQTLMMQMTKAADIGDWDRYNEARTSLNELIQQGLENLQKRFDVEVEAE